MKKKYRIAVKTATALCMILICGCATSGYNRGQFNVISVENEESIGRDFDQKVSDEFRNHGMDYNDSRVLAYVENLGQKLVAYSPERKFEYRFRVVKTPEINAFALPAGYIYVNTGLIAEADNEAELAGVMSHEIGHVVARHWAERYSAMLVASLAAQVLVETRDTQRDRLLTQLAAELVATGGFLAYSRSNEREADDLGLQILYNAGYQPEAMADFFKKMHERTGDLSKVEVFLSTHPDPRERESRMEDEIESLGSKKNLIWDTEEFQKVKNLVSGIKYPEKEKKK